MRFYILTEAMYKSFVRCCMVCPRLTRTASGMYGTSIYPPSRRFTLRVVYMCACIIIQYIPCHYLQPSNRALKEKGDGAIVHMFPTPHLIFFDLTHQRRVVVCSYCSEAVIVTKPLFLMGFHKKQWILFHINV